MLNQIQKLSVEEIMSEIFNLEVAVAELINASDITSHDLLDALHARLEVLRGLQESHRII